MSDMSLSEELAWRGFVNQTTFKDIKSLDGEPITFYWGVDPSASSMTIGNLAAAMMVRHFIDYGHKAVLLVGGATGMVGDPDGKSQERNLMSIDDIQNNKAAIAKQYQQVFGGQNFTLVDNYDWFKDMGYLQFLRELGKHVPMRQMLARDFVQNRLKEGGAGISYAEFSYVLIQAYDFLYMNREMGVTLQLCGSDQWGNSIAGVDLIRRLTGSEAHVWSSPLVINKATGAKFGKSEEGAIWLDPDLTSVYKFYQFWLNVDDEGANDYIKIYTLLSNAEIEQILADFKKNPQERLAQKTLAYEVTKLVHGEEAVKSVQRITAVLFSGAPLDTITSNDVSQLKSELPTVQGASGDSLRDVIVAAGLATSASEAKRLIEQGGIYLNNNKVDLSAVLSAQDRQVAGSALLRRGKNVFALVDIV
ncbi:MAG: tyrosine--tRNA ligase [Patescibacteria group bacterium]